MSIAQHKNLELRRFREDQTEQVIKFDSNFDSGNIGTVEWDSTESDIIVITAEPDSSIYGKHNAHSSWFFFKINGFCEGETVRLSVRKLQVLMSMLQRPWQQYRPAFKIGNQNWKKVLEPAKLSVGRSSKDVCADFSITLDFNNNLEPLFVAFCYPYSVDDNQRYLKSLDEKLADNSKFYYKRERLIDSFECRSVDLLTITSLDGQQFETETLSESNEVGLFPENGGNSISHKFNINKKIVFLTGRVHPGETPCSFAIEGLLDLLTNPTKEVSIALRRDFVFKIVPMLNPDGVFRGHFRTDCLLQDLNRYYDAPDIKQQPSAYAVRTLIASFSSQKRLAFFCDYHAHGLPRNCYLYGNFMQYSLQVETQTFARLMSLHCPSFSADHCDFSVKSMGFKLKKSSKRTKLACSRVATFRSTALIHSFTFEVGYHGEVHNLPRNPGLRPIEDEKITETIVKNNSLVEDDNSDSEHFEASPFANRDMHIDQESQDLKDKLTTSYFTIQDFKDMGQSVPSAMLDLFGLHPTSLLSKSIHGNIQNLRREVAKNIKRTFSKKETQLGHKAKNINELIEAHYTSQENLPNVHLALPSQKTKLRHHPVSTGSPTKRIHPVMHNAPEDPRVPQEPTRDRFPKTRFMNVSTDVLVLENPSQRVNLDLDPLLQPLRLRQSTQINPATSNMSFKRNSSHKRFEEFKYSQNLQNIPKMMVDTRNADDQKIVIQVFGSKNDIKSKEWTRNSFHGRSIEVNFKNPLIAPGHFLTTINKHQSESPSFTEPSKKQIGKKEPDSVKIAKLKATKTLKDDMIMPKLSPAGMAAVTKLIRDTYNYKPLNLQEVSKSNKQSFIEDPQLPELKSTQQMRGSTSMGNQEFISIQVVPEVKKQTSPALKDRSKLSFFCKIGNKKDLINESLFKLTTNRSSRNLTELYGTEITAQHINSKFQAIGTRSKNSCHN